MGIFNLNEDVGTEKPADADIPNKKAESEDGAVTDSVTTIDNGTAVIDTEKAPEETKKEEQMIVLDGPLSQIYTKALNLAYANEGTSTMVSMLEARHKSLTSPEDLEENRIEQGNSVTADGTYVYCVDSTDLDAQGLIEASDALSAAKKVYKEVILAMESGNVISSKMQTLGEMGEALGVKVVMSRGSAVNGVLTAVKR